MHKKPVSVYSIGLSVKTEADGLAVGTASELVLEYTKNLISGCYTVTDDDLMRFVYYLKTVEEIKIEPSAAAGFLGPTQFLGSQDGKTYREKHGSEEDWSNANHVMWTTGGLFVPPQEYEKSFNEGHRLATSS